MALARGLPGMSAALFEATWDGAAAIDVSTAVTRAIEACAHLVQHPAVDEAAAT